MNSSQMSAAKKKKLQELEEEDDDNVLKWFLQFTSVGGLSQLGQSKFILSKIVWLLLLVFGIIMTIFMCVEIYHEYFRYEVRGETDKYSFYDMCNVFSFYQGFYAIGGNKGGGSK